MADVFLALICALQPGRLNNGGRASFLLTEVVCLSQHWHFCINTLVAGYTLMTVHMKWMRVRRCVCVCLSICTGLSVCLTLIIWQPPRWKPPCLWFMRGRRVTGLHKERKHTSARTAYRGVILQTHTHTSLTLFIILTIHWEWPAACVSLTSYVFHLCSPPNVHVVHVCVRHGCKRIEGHAQVISVIVFCHARGIFNHEYIFYDATCNLHGRCYYTRKRWG